MIGPERTQGDAVIVRRFLPRGKALWGLGLALAVTAVAAGAYALGAFQRVEAITYDYRMRWARADAKPDPHIAVILIDESSLAAMNPLVGRFPWPRSVYADLIDFLEMGGARAVVFDILFTEHQQKTGDGVLDPDDRRLAAATAEAGNVYHAGQVVPGRKPGERDLLPPFPALAEASRGIGMVGLAADPDGVYRRARPVFTVDGRTLPGLAVAPLAGDGPLPSHVESDGALHLGGRDIPLTSNGRVLVNQVGDFDAYSAGGIFAALQKLRRGDVRNLPVYPDEFSGKIVFVGASAVGLEDIKATSLSPRTPGVLIHASLASNVLTGDFLAPVPPWMNFLLIALLTGATVAMVLGLRRLWIQTLGPPLLAAGYAGACFGAFAGGGVVAMTPPLGGAALAWLGSWTLLSFTEGREKRRVRRMFSQYVSPEILAELSARPDELLSAEVGREEHLTVLFSDIRGFTSLSEALPASQVVEVLNTYLSAMSEVILDTRGTLDKYVGDAIMAFWGAPVRIPDHAERGVRAAVAMQRRLGEVNRQLQERDYPTLRIGIGLHTADVILGNIGSERKLDYTVIGDSVNLASRLEGLTKAYGCPILISEDTRAALDSDIPCAMVDLVRVKGRQGATAVYWPLALPEDDPETLEQAREQAALTEEAFAAYLSRSWDRARSLLGRLPEDWPLRDIFLERCGLFHEEPPPPDWDGVYTLAEK